MDRQGCCQGGGRVVPDQRRPVFYNAVLGHSTPLAKIPDHLGGRQKSREKWVLLCCYTEGLGARCVGAASACNACNRCCLSSVAVVMPKAVRPMPMHRVECGLARHPVFWRGSVRSGAL